MKGFPLPDPISVYHVCLTVQRASFLNNMRTKCISRRVFDALFYMLDSDEVKMFGGWCDTEHKAVAEPPRGPECPF